MATNQEKLDRIAQIDEAVDVQINAQSGALQTLRRALNTAEPAGLIASQGDINIVLARVDALAKAVAAIPAAVWNQNIGAGNAAGVLNHVATQPAAGTATNAVTGAPFDTDAFIARLVSTLPAATVAAIKNAL